MRYKKINIDKHYIFNLENELKNLGFDSDYESFDEIKTKLQSRIILNSDEFAKQCFYVVLASGFSQKTAKLKHKEIVDVILSGYYQYDKLFNIFKNKNKINAIIKLWENRKEYCDIYYSLNTVKDKLNFLSKLPHIGKITANHLARNLGENLVKYDIWIQRLGVCMYGTKSDFDLIGFPLNENVKNYCDRMFIKLSNDTGYPIGYLDVILWKACQIGLIFG